MPTKLLTSRSDIIVSSTLSITLTPMNNNRHVNTNELSEDGVVSWVNLRNEFRATKVRQAQLILFDDPNVPGQLPGVMTKSNSNQSLDSSQSGIATPGSKMKKVVDDMEFQFGTKKT